MKSRIRNLFPFLVLLVVALVLLAAYGNALAAVTISSFRAQGEPADILITWQTGSEVDNVGFNVLRSNSQNGTYSQINPNLIPGCFCTGGASYQYRDTSAASGQTYYYHLQSVDTSGNKTTTDCVNQCPVSGALSGPTVTPTPTNTLVSTATKTPRPPTATNTPRPTVTKTGTPKPATPTATNAAPTETSEPDVLPTDTPIPEAVLTDFPTATDAPPDTQDSGAVDTPVDSTPVPTKFAFLANPTTSGQPNGLDQTETTTPTAAGLTSTPQAASTNVALRTQPTHAATKSHSAGKPSAPPAPSRRSLGLAEAQTTVLALLMLAVALFGLGVLSGLVGLFMWYLKRSY